ncbi:hypothetical protein BCR33DRAFT_856522 [Rhizoclosmatium globosum]|uniref:IGFBP N-terminal domain-containing protein n=1 Tax=Rhizoclosmatium globosum TaxID=329046 RepID=A0A1Y2BD69_9FUNG|nr:hypothetical protein BCR33DRAFT_856522 [Rhizoclosmatium globosum]|eukprot:ORY32437.1 hypothetical protein BCR33DRAFT_856522 [Rhizoclosmatium globosum]
MQITIIAAYVLSTALTVSAADLKPVPVGGICNVTGQDSVCESNLNCVPTTGNQGICKLKENDVGGECKQDFPNSAVCKAGLVCVDPVLPADGIPRPGTPGTCQVPTIKPSPVGGVCGGPAKAVCESNLDCITASGVDGAQGICALKQSDVGGQCKQVFPNSAVCKPGLVCVEFMQPVNGPPIAGAPGTCKLPSASATSTVIAPVVPTVTAPVYSATAASTAATTLTKIDVSGATKGLASLTIAALIFALL